MSPLAYTLISIAVLALIIIMIYNGLVVARQRTKESYSTVDTQLKRRYDLIPNVVETVKGYAKHENETLKQVIEARNQAMKTKGDNVEAKAASENVLSSALKSIFALSENYPNLKANENFKTLQEELAATETRIQAARQFYNTTVLSLNTKVESFPSNLIAKMFGFKEEKFFELDPAELDAARKSQKVQL